MFRLFLIVLIEGFISIAIEMVAIRQVVPFSGSNVLNTSIIIGVFLLSLAAGYFCGGKVKENHFIKLSKNIVLAQLIFTIGLSYSFLLILFTHLELNTVLVLFIFSLLVITPTLFLIGQTVPILSNFYQGESVGEKSGKILFLSTIGSFLGSVVTTIVVMNYFGVGATITLISFLALITLFFIPDVRKGYLILSFLITLLSTVINNDAIWFIKTNTYANINVVEKNQTKHLIINNGFNSSINRDTNNSNYAYIQKMQSFIKNVSSYETKPLDILVIGAGGFTLNLEDDKNTYTFVDINKDLESIAEKNFLGKKIKGEFIAQDIRNYFLSTEKKYDLIIVDAYLAKISIPPTLTTREFYKQVNTHLSEDGYVVMNIIANPFFGDDFSRHIYDTITEVFRCSLEPESFSKRYVNVLYYCKPKVDQAIYSDNKVNLLEF